MPTTKKKLQAISNVIREFQAVEKDILVDAMQIFLTVAGQPGITQKQLAITLGVSQSIISRNCRALGEWHRLGKPGLNLLQQEEDPAERRRKIVNLTCKGEALVRSLDNAYDID